MRGAPKTRQIQIGGRPDRILRLRADSMGRRQDRRCNRGSRERVDVRRGRGCVAHRRRARYRSEDGQIVFSGCALTQWAADKTADVIAEAASVLMLDAGADAWRTEDAPDTDRRTARSYSPVAR